MLMLLMLLSIRMRLRPVDAPVLLLLLLLLLLPQLLLLPLLQLLLLLLLLLLHKRLGRLPEQRRQLLRQLWLRRLLPWLCSGLPKRSSHKRSRCAVRRQLCGMTMRNLRLLCERQRERQQAC